MFYAVVFPANLIVWRESGERVTMKETYGRNFTGQFASLSPSGLWLKMFVDYCLAKMDGSLVEFCETWPAAGMMRNGKCYRRRNSAHRISASASGLLPTPQTTNFYKTNSTTASPALTLEGMARSGQWPTPRASEHSSYQYDHGDHDKPRLTLTGMARMFPAPVANRWDGLQTHGKNAITGALNPRFVEWLMGYPDGWTDLEDLETL
jgi:hypothetical protein